MARNTLNYRRDGAPALGSEEMYTFAQERYHNLLREAEQYRLAHRDARLRPSACGQPAPQTVRQPLTYLLSWAKLQWAMLTHSA